MHSFWKCLKIFYVYRYAWYIPSYAFLRYAQYLQQQIRHKELNKEIKFSCNYWNVYESRKVGEKTNEDIYLKKS